MKRILVATIVTVGILATPASAYAQPMLEIQDLSSFNGLFSLFAPAQQPPFITPPEVEEEPPEPEPIVYTVVKGDNLTKIGTEHNVEWQRLWAKNTELDHPDVLQIGDEITIPFDNEELERDIPAAISLPEATPGVTERPAPVTNPQPRPASFDNGNTYAYGYCTWYVKNRRGASLPNGLGNANTWYARAAGMGMAVGSVPRPGAVAATTQGALGHVAYVESVNPDGTVNISEMNYRGWGVVTSRTVNANEFLYIY